MKGCGDEPLQPVRQRYRWKRDMNQKKNPGGVETEGQEVRETANAWSRRMNNKVNMSIDQSLSSVWRVNFVLSQRRAAGELERGERGGDGSHGEKREDRTGEEGHKKRT